MLILLFIFYLLFPIFIRAYNCESHNKTEETVNYFKTKLYFMLNYLHFQRLVNCLVTFEKRQELSLLEFPVFFQKDELPLDNRTLSKYCQVTEELSTCLGKAFTSNCLNGPLYDTVVGRYSNGLSYVLLLEKFFCPSETNGITTEDLSCILTTVKLTYPQYYNCKGLIDFKFQDRMIEFQILICRTLDIYKQCGDVAGKLWCRSSQIDLLHPPFALTPLSQGCDSYETETCQCSKNETMQ